MQELYFACWLLLVPIGCYWCFWTGVSGHQLLAFTLLDHFLRQFKHGLRLRQRNSELSIADWCLKILLNHHEGQGKLKELVD